MALLTADELYRFFHRGGEEVRALRGVSLTAMAGEMIALVGPSGSGKSTLLHCLSGLDEPDGGSVCILDKHISRQPESERRRLRCLYMGILRQKDNLFPHLTVLENTSLARWLAGSPGDDARADILRRMGLDGRMDLLPPQLSGGERARAGLAVAMVNHPRLLLLDEPTGEDDADTEKAILGRLADHCAGGGCIIVATHNPALARLASRTLILRDGTIADA